MRQDLVFDQTMNKKLYEKYKKDTGFYEQTQKQEQKYFNMRAEAYHSDLTAINEQILARFDMASHQIYFFYASMYDSNSINVHKLALFFAQNFNPMPSKPYSFVFFNQDAKVDVYGQFKSIFLELSLKHYLYLQNIFLIRPSFYHKAQDFITYNYLPSLIKSKTHHLSSAKQLCKVMEIDQQNFVDFIPEYIRYHEFPNMKPRNLALPQKRMNVQGQMISAQQRESRMNFENDMKAFLFVKPGKQVYNIQDYELSKIGIPVILQLVIFYFKSNPQGLRLEGLFRKSVSIDEENQTLGQLANKNYDYLLQVKNPHIVANLIKRFFANLKTPVIPYAQFQKLMHDQGVKDKKSYIKDIISTIPSINYNSIMYVISFFNQYVIPNQPYNKMTAQNVAICFAPCLMRAQKSGPADLIYASKCMAVNRVLIEQFDYIFGNPSEREQKLRMSQKVMIRQFEEQVAQSILQQKQSPKMKKNEQQNQLQPQKTSLKQHKSRSKSKKKSGNKSTNNSGRKDKSMEKSTSSKKVKKVRLCPTKIKQKCLHPQIESDKKSQINIPASNRKLKREQQSIKNIQKYRRTQLQKFQSQQAHNHHQKRRTTQIRYIRLGQKRKQ